MAQVSGADVGARRRFGVVTAVLGVVVAAVLTCGSALVADRLRTTPSDGAARVAADPWESAAPVSLSLAGTSLHVPAGGGLLQVAAADRVAQPWGLTLRSSLTGGRYVTVATGEVRDGPPVDLGYLDGSSDEIPVVVPPSTGPLSLWVSTEVAVDLTVTALAATTLTDRLTSSGDGVWVLVPAGAGAVLSSDGWAMVEHFTDTGWDYQTLDSAGSLALSWPTTASAVVLRVYHSVPGSWTLTAAPAPTASATSPAPQASDG